MIHITEISKSFGAQAVLNRASLHIRPGMRIGLVGPNGAGKTTLLRIIAGDMSLDEGEINARKDLRIGFLPQEIEEIADHSVIDEVLASYADILDMEHRLKDLGQRVARAYESDPSVPASAAPADGSTAAFAAPVGRPEPAGGPKPNGGAIADAERMLDEMGALQSAFEAAGGYELESRAQAILRGMAFKDADFDRPIRELSGGWRMRVALARLLLEHPDLLLLDEPTNHLDLESLLWLEEFLLGWSGSLVIISHDRYFLNRMATHIVELDRGVLDLYAGDYDHFEQEKRQRYEALSNAAKNQQREIEAAESFVRRFRAKNTKAKQVQQKIRQLERTERIDAPTLERERISFRFPQPGRTGRVVVEAAHVRKAYGETVVYRDLDLVVERGEKIALVGPNGAGKSTLLKLLAGVVEADGGRIKLGYNVLREYYAQHQLEVLEADRSVLSTMEEAAAPVDKMAMVRSYLGVFLFSGDDVEKKVGVLSGGEKARLALARMLLAPAGLLLLDEPTNHLDMVSREVLTEALRQFEGSIVFISHDRHLINAIATEVIEVKGGRLTHYRGDWEYYTWKSGRSSPSGPPGPGPGPGRLAAASTDGLPAGGTTLGRLAAAGAVEASAAGLGPDTPSLSVDGGAAETGTEVAGVPVGRPGSSGALGGPDETRGLSYRERKEVQRRHRQIEKRILHLEARQAELAAVLADPAFMSDYETLFAASEEATEVKQELVGLYPEWEALSDAVGALD